MSLSRPGDPEPGPEARPTTGRGLLLLLAAISALGPVATNLYLPALPDVREYFGTTVATVQTTFSISLVTFAIGLLVWGPVSDRYGRRTAVLTGLAVMITGTVLNFLAPTLGWLIVGRGIQAFGTASGLVVARAIVTDRFPADRIAHTLASLTMVSVVSNSLAPTAGGYLVAGFGWRAIFAVLSVGGIAVAYFAWRGLPASPPRPGPPPRIHEMLVTARQLIRDPLFLQCIVQSTAVYATFFVFMSLAPHLMADAYHRGSTEFGPYYLIVALGYFFGNWSVGRLAAPRGQHWMVVTGLSIQLVASVVALALVLAHVNHPLALFVPLGVMAYGQGLMLPGITATAVSCTQVNVGVASSIIGFVPQLIGALALQAMGTFPTSTVLPLMAYCVSVTVFCWIVLRVGPRVELARTAG